MSICMGMGESIRQMMSGDDAKPDGLGIQPVGKRARNIIAPSANVTAARWKVLPISPIATHGKVFQ